MVVTSVLSFFHNFFLLNEDEMQSFEQNIFQMSLVNSVNMNTGKSEFFFMS